MSMLSCKSLLIHQSQARLCKQSQQHPERPWRSAPRDWHSLYAGISLHIIYAIKYVCYLPICRCSYDILVIYLYIYTYDTYVSICTCMHYFFCWVYLEFGSRDHPKPLMLGSILAASNISRVWWILGSMTGMWWDFCHGMSWLICPFPCLLTQIERNVVMIHRPPATRLQWFAAAAWIHRKIVAQNGGIPCDCLHIDKDECICI